MPAEEGVRLHGKGGPAGTLVQHHASAVVRPALAEPRLRHLVRRRRARARHLQPVRARSSSATSCRRASPRPDRSDRHTREIFQDPDTNLLYLTDGNGGGADGAALHRADPRPAADPGRRDDGRGMQRSGHRCGRGLPLLGLTACARRHRRGARARRSRQSSRSSSRYALTAAYRRGGEVERAALEAELAPIPGADENAVQLGRDLDGDGDPDEIHFHLEVVEIQEEVYPGRVRDASGCSRRSAARMSSPARLPSPTLRVEEGDHVAITLYNTHYLPHTIHLHGTSQSNDMDGVPHMTQARGAAGQEFTYRFVAEDAGHLLVSLPRAGPCPRADGARRHVHHRAEPAEQSLRASRSRRRPHRVDGEGARARNTRANIRWCTWTSTTG